MGARSSVQRVSPSTSADHQNRTELCILILGTIAAGKTTLFRQFLHFGKCKPLERKHYRHIILYNLWEIWNDIYVSCKKLRLNISDEKELFDVVTDSWFRQNLATETVQAMLDLYKCAPVRECLENQQYSSCFTNKMHFLNSLERITADSYIPTEEDILYSYSQTIGIDRISYRTPVADLSVIDIGGNKYSRRKWPDYFSITSLLIFIVDITKFCRIKSDDCFKEREDGEEAVTAFAELCSNITLKKSHFMIIFNKKDVFEKLQPSPSAAPPGGTEQSPTSDANTSLAVIRAKFLNQVTSRKIYQHTLTLLNESTVNATVMESVNNVARKIRAPSPV
ncbi:hypothetical protein AB6A40_008080 [Gnathostoma spinigerum]|uniref:Uncharacterized protein n=1 Tax=Gnathostoma spinigerum TaxID=75299 RepID=A0ABD6EV81_9BILA